MVDTQAPEQVVPPKPKGIGAVGWLRWGWRQLTSMRTALILLFLVALASIPGGLLPQNGIAPEKVAAYRLAHKALAPWMDRLSLFDVFAAPWFVAIYVLLFISLAGCVLPRASHHYKTIKSRPPVAPRNLAKLPQYASYETDQTPAEALATAHAALKAKRFRADLRDGSVSAEKGYLGETGNLLFHLSMLVLLFAIGFGSVFGYKGNVLLTEGQGFSNNLTSYDAFTPGKAFSTNGLSPFTVQLDSFKATYIVSGAEAGQPTSFAAKIRYQATPSAPDTPYNLKVNSPLNLGGSQIYLLGHGYAPTFTVRDGKGNVAFQGSVPFLPLEEKTFTSEGVVKVPDAQPDQLGFYAVFFPAAAPDPKTGQVVSVGPQAVNPVVSVVPFKGNLGLDGGTPQSVYKLEGLGTTLKPLSKAQGLTVGKTLTLPGGAGSITLDGYRQWVSLAINHDPGRVPALVSALLAILGVVVNFLIRRRRVWVRASAAEGGRTVVQVGGLTLGSATTEFDDVVASLQSTATKHEE